MAEQSQCTHEGCTCSIPKDRAAKGDSFCSDYCANHGGKPGHTAHACSCGHPACAK